MGTKRRCWATSLSTAALLAVALLFVQSTFAGVCLEAGQTFSTTAARDGDAPFTVQSCDVDGDGDADLITANDASDTVSVLLNDGAGSFDSLRRWPVGSEAAQFEPVNLTCCDFDGDGFTDIITVNRTSDNISILFGQGIVDGVPEFGAAIHHAVGEAPWAVRCAAVDEDTHLDLVIANFTSDSITVLINDGFGAVAEDASYEVPVGDAPRSLAVCDIDGDDDLDVLTGNLAGKTVTVLRNDGAPGLMDTGDVALNVNPFGIACCQLDGLPGPDIVTANAVDDSVSVLVNDGSGGFTSLGSTPGADGPMDVMCVDLDHDGDFDAATANLSGDDLTVFLNSSGGELSAQVPQMIGESPSSITAGSFSQGSGPELAVAYAEGVSVLANNCAPNTDMDGDGDTDLQDFHTLHQCFGKMMPFTQCASADVDGNGAIDLDDYRLMHHALQGP